MNQRNTTIDAFERGIDELRYGQKHYDIQMRFENLGEAFSVVVSVENG